MSKGTRDLCNDYLKKIRYYCDVHVSEIKEINTPNISLNKEKETQLIQSLIPKNSKVYLCSLQGKQYTSEEFSSLFNEDNITLVIGGSNGVLEDRFVNKISFSKMTLPHQLFRIVLFEQLFRAFNIKNGGKYHK